MKNINKKVFGKNVFLIKFLKSKIRFFCYCIKIILQKFEEDFLKNVGDRF